MDLYELASKVADNDRHIKKLQEELASDKAKLLDAMILENVTLIELDNGKVTLCQRKNKDFGPEIARRELELKADKKRMEVIGDFTIGSITDYIQVR